MPSSRNAPPPFPRDHGFLVDAWAQRMQSMLNAPVAFSVPVGHKAGGFVRAQADYAKAQFGVGRTKYIAHVVRFTTTAEADVAADVAEAALVIVKKRYSQVEALRMALVPSLPVMVRVSGFDGEWAVRDAARDMGFVLA